MAATTAHQDEGGHSGNRVRNLSYTHMNWHSLYNIRDVMPESVDIHRLSKWGNIQEARGKLCKKGLHMFEYISLSQEYNGSLHKLMM